MKEPNTKKVGGKTKKETRTQPHLNLQLLFIQQAVSFSLSCIVLLLIINDTVIRQKKTARLFSFYYFSVAEDVSVVCTYNNKLFTSVNFLCLLQCADDNGIVCFLSTADTDGWCL